MFAAGAFSHYTPHGIAGHSLDLGQAREHTAHRRPQHDPLCHSATAGDSDSHHSVFTYHCTLHDTYMLPVVGLSYYSITSSDLFRHYGYI